MTNRFNKAALLAGTVMAGAMFATPVMAQGTPDEPAVEPGAAEPEGGELIVVTGSRIARRDLETAAPVAVVNSEEFELSGSVNVESVINTLPQVVPGTTSFSNNPGDGTATLNLRGLGAARTLVLVNGRRWMFYNTAQVVDLNTIPQFLLESVDVVTGGASAVYGSDAIAGVVNFRLKDVQGVEIGGQYSLTERGDGARYEIHGAIGSEFADGRGSATVYAEYYKRDSIFQGDREFSNYALGGETDDSDLQQFGSSTLPSGVLRYLGGAQENTGLPAGTEFGAAGTNGFGTGVVFDTAGDFRRRAGDLYNYAPVNYLQLPQERYLIGGYADYELGGGHRAYAEVSYVNNQVQAALAATPVTGSFNVDLATVAPFLVAGDLAQLQAIDAAETAQNATDGVADDPGVVNLYVQRRITETGLRQNLDERNAFRLVGGITGPIGEYLNYDAYYMYSRTRNANIQQGNISRSLFQAGLDGTGTPINIFGPGTLTPEMVDAITIQAQNGDISSLQVATAVISGTFGDFAITEASDPVGFAFGGEYRKVAAQFIPDTALASGDVIGFNAGEPTDGSYDVRELFAELAIPIRFGSAAIDISGAARYSDYSSGNIGGVWTYAGGVEFAPIPDIKLRAQYQRAVRAPNVGELFGGSAINFPGATDPCAVPGAELDATINALCIATGVAPGSVGDPTIRPDTQVPAILGGFANLTEETSDSYTFGVALQPRFIPGLSITADYFSFKIKDAIDTFGGGLNNTLNLCYNVVQDINSEYCQAIVGSRQGNGAITTANPPLLLQDNVASFEVSGIDFQVAYGTTLPFSLFTDTGEQRLQLSFLGTWTEKSNKYPVQDFDFVNECAGRFGATCGEPTPEFKWTSRASFIDGPFTTSVRWRHVGSVTDDDDSRDYTDYNGIEKIDAYDLMDLTFSYAASEALTLTLGVNNLFDTLPGTPLFDANGIVTNRPNSLLLGDNQEQANTYPSTYDVLGRDFFVSAMIKF
ncbi:TonB-dependent receptor [Erythrobacter sp. YJ-T3-07]|uniref:TonB-dependent receptor plug domain-containing protein n=1 Tax=Erythrobacter sp. YJ-T3-07 TaxID=2793063 RepID=UPI0018D4AF3D|nr:TonB-dependent receptor [Erythrobacter sp. YJ-T3-07]MBH1944795.1 TonB-dependent receptor [Erythrobacter sp. YJ-T3-07]